MKDVLLPISAPTLVSAAVGRFGIKVNIFQSDTDSDSSYPNPEFIVATSINRTGIHGRRPDEDQEKPEKILANSESSRVSDRVVRGPSGP